MVVRNRWGLVAIGALFIASACASKRGQPDNPSSDGGSADGDAGGADAADENDAAASEGDDAGEADAAVDSAADTDAGVDYPPPDAACTYADPSRALPAVYDAGGDGAAPAGARIRIMAANTTSGNTSYYDAPGIRLFQGVNPDIVMIQEFKYAGGLRALVDTAFGPSFSFMVEAQSGGIPNGVVSRFPILESGEWEDPDVPDRDFAFARIDIPGPTDLWAVSVHLKTSDATTRQAEAARLVAYIEANVPSGAFVVVGGDLNVSSPTEAAITAFGDLLDVTTTTPVDQLGSDKTNANRSRRYDWLMASPSLEARRMPLRHGASVYCNGLVLDSRVYSPLGEVTPLVRGDSNALNMQHMPVVRDFFVSDP